MPAATPPTNNSIPYGEEPSNWTAGPHWVVRYRERFGEAVNGGHFFRKKDAEAQAKRCREHYGTGTATEVSYIR